MTMTLAMKMTMHCNGEEDGNEDNREVKANGGAGAHVDGGGDFAGERGRGEQGGWKTCANMCKCIHMMGSTETQNQNTLKPVVYPAGEERRREGQHR